MRLHDRYLFRELLTPLGFCLGGFVVFGISFLFFSETNTIQDKKLNLLEALAFCGASLPAFFVLVMPVLLLLALLYALAQHARHHELTAMRAAGLSLWRLCAPYFVVGLLATAGCFAMNEYVVPVCNSWATRILDHNSKPKSDPKNPALSTKRGFSYSPGNRSWFFSGDYDAAHCTIPGPTVKWTKPDGTVYFVQGERAIYTNGAWEFFNALVINASAKRQFRTNQIVFREFDETPEQVRLLLKFSDVQGLHDLGTTDVPLPELWELLRHNPGLHQDAVRKVQTEFYGRLSMPWTCLVVVLIAIPFGAQSGRRNLFFGVAGSIFIVFGYIVLERVALAFGSSGQLPGWLAAVLPNVLFAVIGIVMTLRVR